MVTSRSVFSEKGCRYVLYLCQKRSILSDHIQSDEQGLLAMPNVTASTKSLDSLLIALARIGERVKITATEGLMDCDEKGWLLREALDLDREFKQWNEAQGQRNRPTMIGQVFRRLVL